MLEEAKKKVSMSRDLPSQEVTQGELSEEKALKNWCENISSKCTASNTSDKGIKQTEEILGKPSNSNQHSPSQESSSPE